MAESMNYITWLGPDRPALVDLLGPVKKTPPNGVNSAGGKVEGTGPTMPSYSASRPPQNRGSSYYPSDGRGLRTAERRAEIVHATISHFSPNALDSHRRIVFSVESHLSILMTEKRHQTKLAIDIVEAARKAKGIAGEASDAWRLMIEFAHHETNPTDHGTCSESR